MRSESWHLISKRARRFTGFNDKIIAMYARGMSVREIKDFQSRREQRLTQAIEGADNSACYHGCASAICSVARSCRARQSGRPLGPDQDELRGGTLWRSLSARFQSSYSILVLVAGSSAVLGLARELLIGKAFGLSLTNDRLQVLLSVTFTISLLGEAIRTFALSLLSNRAFGVVGMWVLALGICTSVIVATAFASLLSVDVILPLTIACLTGVLNLLAVVSITAMQRQGHTVRAQLTAALPNYWLALAVPVALLNKGDATLGVLLSFAAAPLLQLIVASQVLLKAADPIVSKASLQVLPDGAARVNVARVIVWSFVGVFGLQFSQFLLRDALLSQGPGLMSVVGPALRLYDSIRAVFVDTIVATKLPGWIAGSSIGKAGNIRARQVMPYVLVSFIIAMLAVQVGGSAPTLGIFVALAAGIPLSGLARMVGTFLIAGDPAGRFVSTNSIVELITAAATLLAVAASLGPFACVVLVYLVRPSVLWIAGLHSTQQLKGIV